MNFFLSLCAVALGAYLVGSFPTGYLVGRYCGIDIRNYGSGNIGATNVMRLLGKKWGYTVFIIDFLKGWLPVFLVMLWKNNHEMIPPSAPGTLAALATLIGHSFPLWLHFRGGKGISTSAGIIVGLFPGSFLFCVGSWFLLFLLTRYVSLASITAAITLPMTVLLFYFLKKENTSWPSYLQEEDWLSIFTSLAMAGLVLWRHLENIKRLLTGTEQRFEKK